MSERKKVCKWCKEKKPLSDYPKVKGRPYTLSVCRDCMPFTIESPSRYLPDCDNCPLYDNCEERNDFGMDPACMAPDRKVLLGFICMPPEDKQKVRKLFEVKLVGTDQIVPDSIDNYFNYYAEAV